MPSEKRKREKYNTEEQHVKSDESTEHGILQKFKDAVLAGRVETVRELILSKNDEIDVNKALEDNIATGLYETAKRGYIEIVQLLVREGQADVNKARTDCGATPLFIAAQHGHLEIVQFLVREGQADVNKATTGRGATPLYIAAEHGHLEIVQFLVREGQADVNKAKTNHGTTPLLVALLENHTTIVRCLVERARADVNKSRFGVRVEQKIPLAVAVMLGNVEAMKILLNRGAHMYDVELQYFSTSFVKTMVRGNLSYAWQTVVGERRSQDVRAASCLLPELVDIVVQYARPESWEEVASHVVVEE